MHFYVTLHYGNRRLPAALSLNARFYQQPFLAKKRLTMKVNNGLHLFERHFALSGTTYFACLCHIIFKNIGLVVVLSNIDTFFVDSLLLQT